MEDRVRSARPMSPFWTRDPIRVYVLFWAAELARRSGELCVRLTNDRGTLAPGATKVNHRVRVKLTNRHPSNC